MNKEWLIWIEKKKSSSKFWLQNNSSLVLLIDILKLIFSCSLFLSSFNNFFQPLHTFTQLVNGHLIISLKQFANFPNDIWPRFSWHCIISKLDISQKSHYSCSSAFNIENNSYRSGIENFLQPLVDRKTKYYYLPIMRMENIAFTSEPGF